MPSSSRDFQRAAGQRLTTAEFLRDSGDYNLDAMYLAGYAVECALKALILHRTPVANHADTLSKITAGKKMHSVEVLAGILNDLGSPMPRALLRKLLQTRHIRWSTNLRYEYGRIDTGETRAFLKTAKQAYEWVGGQLR